MNKKFKIAIICVAVVMTLFILFCLIGGGGIKGVVTPEKQIEKISTVTVTDNNLEQYEFNMDTFTNNIEFDEVIQLKKYNNIKLNVSNDCVVKGLAFNLRTENDTKLTFKVYVDENLIASKEMSLQAFSKAEFAVMFDVEQNLTELSNFCVEICEMVEFEVNETITEFESLNNTNFVFDNLVVLFSEA